jgi:Peptidase family M48
MTLVAVAAPAETPTSRGHLDDGALTFFRDRVRRDLTQDLAAVRPPPLSPAGVLDVVRRLPAEGELLPTRSESTQISALRRILRYHEREDVFVIKVIDVPQAVIGLHARAVLLLSRPALTLLSPAEVQAVVAHEIGHDFFWEEYLELRERPDPRRRQDLELRCDGIAVLTLLALRLKVSDLVVALRKLVAFNNQLGVMSGVENYPRLSDRARFIAALNLHATRVQAQSLTARARQPPTASPEGAHR